MDDLSHDNDSSTIFVSGTHPAVVWELGTDGDQLLTGLSVANSRPPSSTLAQDLQHGAWHFPQFDQRFFHMGLLWGMCRHPRSFTGRLCG